MTLEELLRLPLAERIKWVRMNGPDGELSHDKFATRLGIPKRQTVINWEPPKPGSKRTPHAPSEKYAQALADYSGFPVTLFRPGEEERLTLAAIHRRLEALAARVGTLESDRQKPQAPRSASRGRQEKPR